MIVGERAGLENFPELEAAQFDFRAEFDVASEQADERRVRQTIQFADELHHSGADIAVTILDQVVKPVDIVLEEAPEVFLGVRDVAKGEHLAHERNIRATGEAHLLDAFMHAKDRGEGAGKRLDARAACADERAVNVEQNQSNHAGKG